MRTSDLFRPFLLVVLAQSTQSQMTESLDFTFDARSEKVSLHEPVILSFRAVNRTPSPITIDLGSDKKERFAFAIELPDGKAVQLRLPRKDSAEVLASLGTIAVAPASEYQQTVILDDWYRFTQPGTYQVVAAVSGTAAHTRIPLTVTELDPDRLRLVCGELAAEMYSADSYEKRAAAALALSYANDAIAVPYLLAEATRPGSMVAPIVIAGLGRIEDQSAIDALVRVERQADTERAALARGALSKMAVHNPELVPRIREAEHK